jgi:hypothetical protein
MTNGYQAAIATIVPSPWSSTYTLKPDIRQIEASIKQHGVMAPVVLRSDGLTIIDGHTRVNIAHRLGWDTIWAVHANVDEIDAMILHLRMNRNRGDAVARRVSVILRRILAANRFDPNDLRLSLGMTKDEFDVLADGTILKHRKIATAEYSAAWVPFETDTGEDIRIERPTGKKEQV